MGNGLAVLSETVRSETDMTNSDRRAGLFQLGDFRILLVPTVDSLPVGQVTITVNGTRLEQPVSLLRLTTRDRRHAALLLFRADCADGDVLVVNHATGGVVFDGVLGVDAVCQTASPDDIWQFVAASTDPLRLTRKIIEGLCLYLKGCNSGPVIELAQALGQRCVRQSVAVDWIMPLGDGAVLCRMKGQAALPVIDAGQMTNGADGYQRITRKPLFLNNGRDALIVLDVSMEMLGRSNILFWSSHGAITVTAGQVPIVPLAKLSQIVSAAQGEKAALIRFLGHHLVDHVEGISGIRAVLAGLRQQREVVNNTLVNLADGAFLISRLVRLADGAMILFGWCHDHGDSIEDLSWIDAFGKPQSLWSKRQPLAHHGAKGSDDAKFSDRDGFVICFKTPPTCLPFMNEQFQLRIRGGAEVAIKVSSHVANDRKARDLILALPKKAQQISHDLIATGLAPAIRAAHRGVVDNVRVRAVHEFGQMPEKPRCSIIIPLYRNLSFLKPLATALAIDPDLANDEIVFVGDDPDSQDQVFATLEILTAIYGLNARFVCHDENYGYAPAITTGVGHSKAPTILHLNSDVLPERQGWLALLLKKLKSRKVAAVGPKLLFANGTLQHAGLGFFRDHRGRLYNRTLYKGYARDYPAADKAGKVDALTGACLLLDRRAYEAVGGISTDYVVGDFEDTDLCLRLRQAGYDLTYEPKAVLYHFERQSIGQHDLHNFTLAEEYNQWLHQTRWFGEAGIEPLFDKPDAGSGRK